MHPVPDTVQINMRSSVLPFNVVDSAIVPSILEGNHPREAMLFLKMVLLGSSYYIELKHRNSIATWSANPIAITSDNTMYDFTTSVNAGIWKQYGNE